MSDTPNKIQILKVVLLHGHFPTISYKEMLPDNDERNHPNVKCSAPVHEDFSTIFAQFKPHFALKIEEITNEQFIEAMPEDFEPADYSEMEEFGEAVTKAIKSSVKKIKDKKSKTKITTVIDGEVKDITSLLGDKDEEETIMDMFRLDSIEFKQSNGNNVIVMNGSKRLSTHEWTPISSPPINDSSSYRYPFKSDLFQLAEGLKFEVQEYLVNRKYAPPANPELNFGDGVGVTDENF